MKLWRITYRLIYGAPIVELVLAESLGDAEKMIRESFKNSSVGFDHIETAECVSLTAAIRGWRETQ